MKFLEYVDLTDRIVAIIMTDYKVRGWFEIPP